MIYITCFKGLPDKAFFEEKELDSYLLVQGTNRTKIASDMEYNATPEWEIHEIEVVTKNQNIINMLNELNEQED